MPMFNQALQIDNAILIYDGISRPESVQGDNGQPPGTKYNVKIAIPMNSPDHMLLDQMSNTELQAGLFRGVLPQGAYWTYKQVAPGEFNDMLHGHVVINASTFRAPSVFDSAGNAVPLMNAGPLLFQGQRLDVLIDHVKSYSHPKGGKGVKCVLDGFRIRTADQAQPMSLGGGGGQAAAAFGGQQQGAPGAAPGQQQPAQQWGQPGQPQQQAPAQQQPPQQWGQSQQQAPAQQQPPQQWGQPQQQAPAQQWGQPGQPQQQAPAQQNGGYQPPPQQASNYLPQQ